jgi:hypothetical protein
MTSADQVVEIVRLSELMKAAAALVLSTLTSTLTLKAALPSTLPAELVGYRTDSEILTAVDRT